MAGYQLKFHPRFITELEGAIGYYNDKSLLVCKRFRSAIKKQLSQLKANPLNRSARYDDIRFARIEKFPYAIHFTIDKVQKVVLIHALLSDHQDPATNWRKRF